jgi:ProP effector
LVCAFGFFQWRANGAMARRRRVEKDTMSKQRLTVALDLIGILAERFPACFTVNPSYRRPLKIGIHHDVAAALSDTVTPREVSDELRLYVSNFRYLKALMTDAVRVDLNGEPAGKVTAEHAAIALAQYERRSDRQKAKLAVAPAKPPKLVAAAPRRIGLADLKTAAQARRVALP